MKEATIILLWVAALANGGIITAARDGRQCNYDPEALKICEANFGTDNLLIAHQYCDKFYKCSNGIPYAYKCAANLLYDPLKEECEWPHLVDCGDRPMSPSDDISGESDCNGENDSGSESDTPGNDNGGSDNGGNDNGGNDNNGANDISGANDNDSNENNGTCNCSPEEAPAICASEDSSGILIAHENCNQFYKCDHGKPVEFTCGPNTLYNPYTGVCDWPKNVECGDRVIPESDSEDDGGNDNSGDDGNNGGSDNEGNDNDGNDNEGNDNNSDENNDTCNCNPEEAPAICASEDSSGILVAHENCNQFYKCDHGKPVEFTCGPNTLYNPYTGVCDWPKNVECGDRVIPESDSEDDGGNDNSGDDGNNGGSDNEGNDNEGNDNEGNDNNSEENNDTCNCNPEEAPAICASEDSSGILVAHENCNQFYKCDHGKPVEFTCGPNTLYNPYTGVCDWPKNVECGDRVIPESDSEDDGGNDNSGDDGNNGGSDNEGNDNEGNDNEGNDNNSEENNDTCNCNPEEAPAICASEDSSGILVAHENCNQFYKCDHGKPVEFTCGPNTLYNPYTGVCDWPKNVECGDRVIPELEDDSGNDNGGNDSNGGDDNNSNNDNNGGNDNNGSNDNGGNDSNSNENNGTCNCNPEEAPAICASEDSSGILVAHENCNQFYKCDHGKPVEFTCGPNTLYNPYTGVCDWPKNVECGDRVIPESDSEDDGGNDNSGDDGNNGGSDNEDNDNEGNDNEGNDNEGNDNEGNDNEGNDNEGNDNEGNDNNSEENNDTCNCNPEEAPAICASEDSSGILVAHENCNQFYKCDHGKPVEFKCSANTLYNPFIEACDWPRNVDCGDRVIPDDDNGSEISNNHSYSSLNKHMESRYAVKEL